MKIIGADERLAEPRGVKALIVGLTGVGKTSLLRTLDPTRTLFVDIEAGDLSVQDVPVDMFRLDDWGTARDLACRIGGPNPSFPANACYSEAHYQAVGGTLDQIDRYDTIFVDSITAVSRLSTRPLKAANAGAKSSARRISNVAMSRPRVLAVASTSLISRTAAGAPGLTIMANLRRPGTTSRNRASRLPARSVDCIDRPVTLPPGRARLATRPLATGSSTSAITIGMTDVACFAATTGAAECVTMTSTLSRTNSATISAKRSVRPSAHR